MFDLSLSDPKETSMISSILKEFGLNEDSKFYPLNSGLINRTWKICNNDKNYILQEINHQVFKRPEDIDKNLTILKKYLLAHYPDYLFVAPLPAANGSTLIQSGERYYRLFDFIPGSETISAVRTCNEAYEAAKQFGKFSRL